MNGLKAQLRIVIYLELKHLSKIKKQITGLMVICSCLRGYENLKTYKKRITCVSDPLRLCCVVMRTYEINH